MESFFPSFFFEKMEKFIKEADSILLLSHLDADGLSSAGLISRLLKSFDKTFTVRILKQLENDEDIKEFSNDLVIITDMGSGQLNMIKNFVESKRFIIIDHHQIQDGFEHDNLIHFNPGLNDDSYSGSSLAYYIIKTIKPELSFLVHFGLVGAVGDSQYKNGFKGLNKEILDYGISKNFLKMSKGIDIFGRVSKPLHEALAYSFELLIPGVSGNESGAIEFLSELNIDLKNENGEWVTLNSLKEQDMKKLVSNIIMRRLAHKLDSNIFSNIITINNGRGVMSDLKELSVLLNACGRQGAYSLGVLLCMGFEDYTMPLIEGLLKEYRKLIVESLNLVRNEPGVLSVEKDLIIIDAGSRVKDTIIGTVAGMILKSSELKANTIIGLADRDADYLKVSCRTIAENNIGVLLKSVCGVLKCQGGGHKFAGGALVLKSRKDDFLKMFKEELWKHL